MLHLEQVKMFMIQYKKQIVISTVCVLATAATLVVLTKLENDEENNIVEFIDETNNLAEAVEQIAE